MSTSSLLILLVPTLVALGTLAVFLIHVAIRYTPIVGRVFEEKPLFLPLRVSPLQNDGEEVSFTTKDGLKLAGTYLTARTASRLGVLVFCHEYLSDRWSYRPYADYLRDLGFDIFTFDFRNHGKSESDPQYKPLQWVTDHETADLRGALAYLRTRPDRDPAGFGLYGISRGGGTALVTAARDPGVWGVITDGAFPTRGTMLAYILRWAEIYVGSPILWKRMPLWVFSYVGFMGRMQSQRNLRCHFPDVERAVARLAPRPWLMIHGGKDAYIGPEIARLLFAEAREPKELWIVPGAKHNRCREVQPESYAERVSSFLGRVAPRRPLPKETAVPVGQVTKEMTSSGVL
ncbi:Serine aminopeptidase, S33 [Singulisphaera sp. GP187]|uniref:alpha/beta hydrolase n=1 Tax=Singulisphaera sp. GP187 TaxID=1882752 RepID=UPI0009284BDD|nr:alpha/beta fold hydrolase [Singulisphaera sp. GP187]SIO04229.1 Serine aminopeptidase, S33 [Singulisphaera sp. GP187]